MHAPCLASMTANVLLAFFTSLLSLRPSNRSQSTMANLSIVCWRHRIDSRSFSSAICCDNSAHTTTYAYAGASPATGHVYLLEYKLFIFFRSLQSGTNSNIRLNVLASPRPIALSPLYCMNFMIFLCVTLKLSSLKFGAPPCTKPWRRHCIRRTYLLFSTSHII